MFGISVESVEAELLGEAELAVGVAHDPVPVAAIAAAPFSPAPGSPGPMKFGAWGP